MKCQNCSTVANPGESFCKVCGTNLNSQPVTYNQPQQQINQQTFNQQQGYNQSQQGYNQQQQSYNQPQQSYSEEEELLDAFIGPNAFKLKDNSFSVCTLLFGALYTLYRKMWLLSLIWIVGSSVVTSILGPFAGVITLGASIYFSIEFKKLYVKNAREEIAKIKYQYPNMPKEQLINILRQKGGTTIWPVIVSGIISLALIALIAVPFFFAALSDL